jgi:hypothetical protein
MNRYIPAQERRWREADAADLLAQQQSHEAHAEAFRAFLRQRIEDEPRRDIRDDLRTASGGLETFIDDWILVEAHRCRDRRAELLEPLDEEDRADERNEYYWRVAG